MMRFHKLSGSDPVRRQGGASTVQLGMIMGVLAVGLVVAMLTLMFDKGIEHRENPNAVVSGDVVNGVRQVVLERNAAGHYVAAGTINGSPVVFLLDTGATGVSVPAGLAETLGLKRGREMIAHTANGTVTVYATRLDEVGLGNIVQRGVPGSVNPGMQGNEVLLGMTFLKHLELNQSGRTLTLRQPE